jgi:hypothetical protein
MVGSSSGPSSPALMADAFGDYRWGFTLLAGWRRWARWRSGSRRRRGRAERRAQPPESDAPGRAASSAA